MVDNGGFQDVEEGTELGLVKSGKSLNGSTSASSVPPGPSTSCKPEVCQAARKKYQPPDLSDSPWHKFKSIALIVTIVLLIIWVIVYTVISQLKLV